MAEHAPSNSHSGDANDHQATYANFLKGAAGLSLFCFFILVALVSFRYGQTFNVFMGFAGLIAGLIAISIDARSGGRWLLSIGVLVVFGILTAINIS